MIAPDEYLGNKLLLEVLRTGDGENFGLLKAVLEVIEEYFACVDVRLPRLQTFFAFKTNFPISKGQKSI